MRIRTGHWPVAAILVTSLAPSALVAEEDRVPAGRYVRVTSEPALAQRNPLQAIISVSFPREQVTTLGEAATYLLERSGYTMADVAAPKVDAAYGKLLRFTLPEVQREFRSVSLWAALEALAGPSYMPTVNHVDRTVAFRLRPNSVATPRSTVERRVKRRKTARKAASAAPSPRRTHDGGG